MDKTFRIAPSILSANFAKLGQEIADVIKSGTDIVHFDVMDNHYVPNLTIGPLVCEAIRPITDAIIDVHLMVKPVDRIIPDFAKAGANIITFHPEGSDHIDRSLSLVRDSGCKSGLVFNPATPLDYLDHVMDNHYVPNLTIGPLVCEAIRPVTDAIIDVHLMVKPVDRIIPDFAKAGANIITFHPEGSDHIDRSLSLVRDSGCKSGLVFSPATPLDYLDHVMDKIDMILLMSVNPGFGGQKFIPETLNKLRIARQKIDAYYEKTGRQIWLEVDGGVNANNIAEIAKAGADTFVAGSAIFGAGKDTDPNHYDTVVKSLRASLATV